VTDTDPNGSDPSNSDPTDAGLIMPAGIAPPAANYAHARLTVDASRWLHTSGVVPVGPDGSVPSTLVEQAEVIWANIGAMLADAGMAPSDVVSVTTYVTPGHDLGPVMAVRDRALAGHLAASTLLAVPELARPEWLMEIAVIAAR
jgi:enamine deaminase RidA (YjgF/YER057c/UK114 family)